MPDAVGVTGAQGGLSRDDHIRIALEAIASGDGTATMQQIYDAVNQHLNGRQLNEQGRASLRRLVNSAAVQAGYVLPHDPNHPGWHITPEGRQFLAELEQPQPPEEVINLDTQQPAQEAPNRLYSATFEKYVEGMMKCMYPRYAWYHQGADKRHERGLDLIGTRLSDDATDLNRIGVQVKLHQPTNAPALVEWLKFLAGCYARHIARAIFVTSGKLTSDQQREAGEAHIIVIAGKEEIDRLARTYEYALFDWDALAQDAIA